MSFVWVEPTSSQTAQAAGCGPAALARANPFHQDAGRAALAGLLSESSVLIWGKVKRAFPRWALQWFQLQAEKHKGGTSDGLALLVGKSLPAGERNAVTCSSRTGDLAGRRGRLGDKLGEGGRRAGKRAPGSALGSRSRTPPVEDPG